MSHRNICGSAGLLVFALVLGPIAEASALRTPGLVASAKLSPITAVVIDQGLDAQQLRAAHTDGKSSMEANQFAQRIDFKVTPLEVGAWDELADGRKLWRLWLEAPGALSLNLYFDRFELPPGFELWIRDLAGEQIHGPYGGTDAKAGQFWSPVVVGNTIVIEMLTSGDDEAIADLRINNLNWGFRFFGEEHEANGAKQGSCNIDVVCPQGDPWRDQIRSVARYTISGQWLCTGNLINNTAQDFKPLFLTADHCGVTSSSQLSTIFYWNYEATICGALGGGSLLDNQRGATLLATWSWEPDGSDFSLLELDDEPSAGSGVYYAGWDAGANVPEGAVGIHHPSGDVKAISFENDPLESVWGTHWVITGWDEGTTEGGSSGSCIFDPTSKLCVGTLSGGQASCSIPDGNDYYGKISVGWEGNGTPESRLRDWLDPIASGATSLQGMDSLPGQAPVASFVFSPASPGVGTPVYFKDTSANQPTSWAWDFGDGISSISFPNPAHSYNAAGTYDVSLTVSNDWGFDTVVEQVVVAETQVEEDSVFFAAAAAIDGVGGSYWSTDVEVNNRGAAPITYTVRLLKRNEDNSHPQEAGPFELGPGKGVRYAGIISELFAFDGAGGLEFVIDRANDAILTSRTFNTFADASLSGTFGQAIPAVPAGEMIPAGKRVRLIQLTENDLQRSNIGFLNGTAANIRIQVEFFFADGRSLGELYVDLAPYSNTQWNSAFTKVTSIDIDDGYVDVWTETPKGEFSVYGSVVGNDDFNDPTTITPQ